MKLFDQMEYTKSRVEVQMKSLTSYMMEEYAI